MTDKAKEKVGSKPAPFYGPSAARSSTAAESAEDPLLSSGATPDRSAAFGSSGPLYRSGDLVFVRPLRATLWVAQLTEPVIEISPGCFNVDRPTCRYFVRTEALAGYPHALDWWEARGQGLRLADEAAAMARAAASDGVHFSFEKTDRVTRSTICGRFEPASILEHVTWRNQLVSFAIPELVLAHAREQVSSEGLEADVEHEQPPVTAVAAARASSVSTASGDTAYLELAHKRQLAYQLQQMRKDEKAKEQRKQ